MKLPVIVINLKTYPKSTGKMTEKLIKSLEKSAGKRKEQIIVAPQNADLHRVSNCLGEL